MALYPDCLKKAQAEIDRVVGNDRLPAFSDRESLPYIDALVKESLRWYNVVPMGKLCPFTPLLVVQAHTTAQVSHTC